MGLQGPGLGPGLGLPGRPLHAIAAVPCPSRHCARAGHGAWRRRPSAPRSYRAAACASSSARSSAGSSAPCRAAATREGSMRPSSGEGTARHTAARRRTAARSAGRRQAAAAATAATAARAPVARRWQRDSTWSPRERARCALGYLTYANSGKVELFRLNTRISSATPGRPALLSATSTHPDSRVGRLERPRRSTPRADCWSQE